MLKDRKLLGGFVVTIIALGLQLLSSKSGVNIDINPLEDQELLLSEALFILGLIATGYSQKFRESVKAERSGVS